MKRVEKMLDLTGKLTGASVDFNGKISITLEINEEEAIKNGYDKYNGYECVDVKIQK